MTELNIMNETVVPNHTLRTVTELAEVLGLDAYSIEADTIPEYLEQILKPVKDSGYKKPVGKDKRSDELAQISKKLERVIPLLLRAMQSDDDADLLEASIDLLAVKSPLG